METQSFRRVSEEIRPKLFGNFAFPQNFHNIKLSEITVFHAMNCSSFLNLSKLKGGRALSSAYIAHLDKRIAENSNFFLARQAVDNHYED